MSIPEIVTKGGTNGVGAFGSGVSAGGVGRLGSCVGYGDLGGGGVPYGDCVGVARLGDDPPLPPATRLTPTRAAAVTPSKTTIAATAFATGRVLRFIPLPAVLHRR
jgi:hypothetical protein